MTLSFATEPPVYDRAAVEAARLVTAARSRLLATGVVTLEMLAEGRNTTVAAARQWHKRARSAGRVLTVTHDGRVHLPTFQFDRAFDLRDDVAGVVVALHDVGLDDWAAWRWLTAGNGWIDGRSPLEAIDGRDTDVVVRALAGLSAQADGADEIQSLPAA